MVKSDFGAIDAIMRSFQLPSSQYSFLVLEYDEKRKKMICFTYPLLSFGLFYWFILCIRDMSRFGYAGFFKPSSS